MYTRQTHTKNTWCLNQCKKKKEWEEEKVSVLIYSFEFTNLD